MQNNPLCNVGLEIDGNVPKILFFRLIGSIPGPIFFGFIIDQTCLLKVQDGNCLFYDNWTMALYLSLIVFIVKSVGVAFFILALYFSNRSPIADETIDLDAL